MPSPNDNIPTSEIVVGNVIDVCDERLLANVPLVSVHMLAYRHGRFLAQAIGGVLAQACGFPFELIIAEDCSPDDTLEIALTYQRRNPAVIRVIHGKRNVGMHANARQSMPFCRGKYVAFCEGDDYWHDTNKLTDQIRLMDSDPGMVLCHTDFDRLTRFRRKRNVHRTNHRIKPASGHAYHDLLQTWSVMTATSVYRHEVLLAFGNSPFYSSSWPFGDLNLLLYASLQGTIGYIDRSTATFRKMRGSAGNRGLHAALAMQLAAAECVEQFMKAHPVTQDAEQVAIAQRKLKIYTSAYFAGRLDLMNECHAWLLQHGHPHSPIKHALRQLAIRLVLPQWIHARGQQFITDHLSAIQA